MSSALLMMAVLTQNALAYPACCHSPAAGHCSLHAPQSSLAQPGMQKRAYSIGLSETFECFTKWNRTVAYLTVINPQNSKWYPDVPLVPVMGHASFDGNHAGAPADIQTWLGKPQDLLTSASCLCDLGIVCAAVIDITWTKAKSLSAAEAALRVYMACTPAPPGMQAEQKF